MAKINYGMPEGLTTQRSDLVVGVGYVMGDDDTLCRHHTTIENGTVRIVVTQPRTGSGGIDAEQIEIKVGEVESDDPAVVDFIWRLSLLTGASAVG